MGEVREGSEEGVGSQSSPGWFDMDWKGSVGLGGGVGGQWLCLAP